MVSRPINDSVALVTGAAHGLGEGFARRLAGQGAQVVIADIDVAAGEALAREIGGHFVRCDVTKPEDNQRAVRAAMDRYKDLHIVALNAGISSTLSLGERFDPEEYQRMMRINVDGVVHGAQAAYPALRDSGGGQVIATGSIGGLYPTPLAPLYAGTKAFLIQLVRSQAPLWAKEGIALKALCPGFTDTDMIDDIREMLTASNVKVLEMSEVAAAFMKVLTEGRPGECWYELPGLASGPFRFGKIEGFPYRDPAANRQQPGREAGSAVPFGGTNRTAPPGPTRPTWPAPRRGA